jgi:hypothetical protein
MRLAFGRWSRFSKCRSTTIPAQASSTNLLSRWWHFLFELVIRLDSDINQRESLMPMPSATDATKSSAKRMGRFRVSASVGERYSARLG